MEKKWIDRKMTEAVIGGYIDRSEGMFMEEWNIKYKGQDWIIATNGHEFVMVPEHDGNRLLEARIKKKFPDLECLLPETFALDIPITLDQLVEVLKMVPLVEDYRVIDCGSCDGEGKFWHYRERYKCKSCEGKGKIKYSRKEKFDDPEATIKIKDCHIKPKYLKNMGNYVLFRSKEKDAVLRHQDDRGLSIFEIPNGILVGIMAKSMPDMEKVIELKFDKQ